MVMIVMRQPSRRIIPALACTALWLGGCIPSESAPITTDPPKTTAKLDSQAVWPYWPTHLRVHPLTRFSKDAADPNRTLLEARIEFLDAQEITAKACGQLTLEVIDGDLPPKDATAIKFWNIDLRDAAVNQRQFDFVTRTYLCKLDVDPEALPAKPALRVMFVSTDGRTMEDLRPLRK